MTNEFEKDKPKEDITVEEVLNAPNDSEQEMTPGDFGGYNYIKTPSVGNSIELTVKKIVKAKSRELENANTGKKFWTGLEDKKGNRAETILETIEGERFTIDTWSVYFNLFGKECDFQKLANEKGSYAGIKIKITHNFNGKDSGTEPEDIMKLRDLPTIEAAKEHIATVAKAMKDGTLYTVEVLNK